MAGYPLPSRRRRLRSWKRAPAALKNLGAQPAGPSAGTFSVALSLRTARAETAKLTVDLKPGAGGLHVLSEDPNDMTNRFDEPAYQAPKDELSGHIARRANNVGPLNEPVGMA